MCWVMAGTWDYSYRNYMRRGVGRVCFGTLYGTWILVLEKNSVMERSSITEYLSLRPALRHMVGVCLFLLRAVFSPSFVYQLVCSDKVDFGIHIVRRKMPTPTVSPSFVYQLVCINAVLSWLGLESPYLLPLKVTYLFGCMSRIMWGKLGLYKQGNALSLKEEREALIIILCGITSIFEQRKSSRRVPVAIG